MKSAGVIAAEARVSGTNVKQNRRGDGRFRTTAA